MKKYKYIPFFLLTSNLMAFNGDISSNIDFKYDYKEKHVSYNFNVFDLNIEAIDNLKLNLVLKSQRENILKSDDNKKSHDFQSKIKFEYDKKINDNLKLKSNLIYYIYKDDKSEFLEENSKEALGNGIIGFNLDYQKDDLLFDFYTKYKASNFYDFSKDESYFKLGSKISKKNINFNYDMFIDLNLMTKQFKPLNEDNENEFKEILVNKYIKKLEQKASLDYVINDITLSSLLKYNLYLGSSSFKSKPDIIINEFIPNFKIEHNKEISLDNKNKLTFTNYIDNKFEIENTKIYGDFDMIDSNLNLSYIPTLSSKLKYSLDDVAKFNIAYSIDYTPNLILKPYLVKSENLRNVISNNLDFNIDYNNLNITSKNNIKTDIVNNKLNKLNTTLDFDLKYVKDIFKNLKFIANFNNKFNITTRKNNSIIDYLKDSLNFNLELNYLYSDLKFNNKLEYMHYNFHEYVIRTVNNKEHGKFHLKENLNTFTLNNTLSYTKKYGNFILTPSLNTQFKLDTIVLSSDMIALKKKDKVYLEASDYINTNINVGGSIKITPKLDIDINVIENLEFNLGFSVPVLFEKNILNKVDDENRLDNKLYDYIDKNFNFKNINPSFSLGLKYRW